MGSTWPNRWLLLSRAAVRSMGFRLLAKPGSTASMRARVSAGRGGTCSPCRSAASAPVTQAAPELLRMARRLPGRWPQRSSNCAPMTRLRASGTRRMPCWRNQASSALSSVAMAPVCDCAACRPCGETPAFRASTGTWRERASAAARARVAGAGRLSM
ncbi:Uncharacterised protein [Bordetella pertussis]|nr:Uncharacterised protein [Bordetella pertussis]CPK20069.1 Uncharacterised protein [Bordetella pertussis]